MRPVGRREGCYFFGVEIPFASIASPRSLTIPVVSTSGGSFDRMRRKARRIRRKICQSKGMGLSLRLICYLLGPDVGITVRRSWTSGSNPPYG